MGNDTVKQDTPTEELVQSIRERGSSIFDPSTLLGNMFDRLGASAIAKQPAIVNIRPRDLLAVLVSKLGVGTVRSMLDGDDDEEGDEDENSNRGGARRRKGKRNSPAKRADEEKGFKAVPPNALAVAPALFTTALFADDDNNAGPGRRLQSGAGNLADVIWNMEFTTFGGKTKPSSKGGLFLKKFLDSKKTDPFDGSFATSENTILVLSDVEITYRTSATKTKEDEVLKPFGEDTCAYFVHKRISENGHQWDLMLPSLSPRQFLMEQGRYHRTGPNLRFIIPFDRRISGKSSILRFKIFKLPPEQTGHAHCKKQVLLQCLQD
jgi:hypothetical protein